MRISDWSSDVCSSDLTAMGQQGTAVFRLQAELPAEQEIAAVKSDIVATLDHGHAVLRIPAEHAAHDMHGRQDPGAAAMGESGPIAAIVPQRLDEQTAELQSLIRISYAVFCLKKKNQ